MIGQLCVDMHHVQLQSRGTLLALLQRKSQTGWLALSVLRKDCCSKSHLFPTRFQQLERRAVTKKGFRNEAFFPSPTATRKAFMPSKHGFFLFPSCRAWSCPAFAEAFQSGQSLHSKAHYWAVLGKHLRKAPRQEPRWLLSRKKSRGWGLICVCVCVKVSHMKREERGKRKEYLSGRTYESKGPSSNQMA
ncbi:hypothetical protein B0T21DRAFT_26775 [Apiosordaria backusii]|uniref:Uncharacterized protein n=1 Tax=Apiosordaria backusii TaxID=314023 RepID=A0AA40K7D8_9PEZI|nr:hypothetical protein B0T21DRAFT_26775 [Apiosordaria backusii]